MTRKPLVLELLPEDRQKFESIGLALDHDDPEETFKTLLNLGYAAVAITNKENRDVKLIGGVKRDVGEKCSECGVQREIYEHEIAVTLGISERNQEDVSTIPTEE